MKSKSLTYPRDLSIQAYYLASNYTGIKESPEQLRPKLKPNTHKP